MILLLASPHDSLQFWLLDSIAGVLVLVIGFVGAEFAKQIKGLRNDFQGSQVNNARLETDVNNLVVSNRDLWDEMKDIREEISILKEGAMKRGTLINELEKSTYELKKDVKEVTQIQNRCISCNDNKK